MTKQEKERLEPIMDVLMLLLDSVVMDDTERTFELFWPDKFLHFTGDPEEDFEIQKDRFHAVDYYVSEMKDEIKRIMK